ncbi:MAG TPA: FAD:protein FMN transferase [Candidatus Limnocylindria bacterium]|nr:FAD:protein FMN transferase [Candidatus Limnocylindria bacterium]
MKSTIREARAMGSPLRLTLPGSCADGADAAWEIVRRVFTRAERDLSRFASDSPLSRLNRSAGSGYEVDVPPMLVQALAAPWRAFRASGGRFDPRIIGALEAAGEHAGVELPASPGVLAPADRWLTLDARRRTAAISAPIDLGGIGKGLALRWAAAALRHAGHPRFLLSAGGDVVAAGDGPANRPWVVGVEDPTGRKSPLATMELADAAVATSSIAVRSWRDASGGLAHHLIDPKTQAPADPVWSAVTVVDRDPAWAEVRSKVAFLAGRRIAEMLRGRRAWWVAESGDMHSAA